MVKISPEWVTGPEQGKYSGRIATYNGLRAQSRVSTVVGLLLIMGYGPRAG